MRPNEDVDRTRNIRFARVDVNQLIELEHLTNTVLLMFAHNRSAAMDSPSEVADSEAAEKFSLFVVIHEISFPNKDPR